MIPFLTLTFFLVSSREVFVFSCAGVDFVRVEGEKIEGRMEGKEDGGWREC